jgi:hypothetical protein
MHLVSAALKACVSLYIRSQDGSKSMLHFIGDYRVSQKMSWEVGLNSYRLIQRFDKNLLILNTNFKDNYFSKFFC